MNKFEISIIIILIIFFELGRRAKKKNSWINTISINWLDYLKHKWLIKSNFDIILILIVFSLTGSISVWIAKPILTIIGLEKDILSPYLYWPSRVLIIFPIYQILIVIIGSLFGQFKFFWNFEKKMLSRLGFNKFKQE